MGNKKPPSKQMKSGRITKNPYLNFMRDFRRNHGGMNIIDLTKQGAEMWRNMTEKQKAPYFAQAKQAPRRYNRHKRRRRHRSYSSSDEEKPRRHKRRKPSRRIEKENSPPIKENPEPQERDELETTENNL
ncbi:unnamed protein product [Brassicogethes aeneus]|uniref:HMG box domain-containing protein n=1 Tax=Brassicogethes aeneus TaxID=1431903 RepID=A0A9P0BL13_BRAAE|nr:unnamed protein product [Brassicogethes aeneus]